MATELSDSFINHPVYVPQNQTGLDLNLLKELPDSHAWISQDDFPTADISSEKVVVPTVIDLEDKNAQKLIGAACKKWGIFQVINHGISKTLIDDIESAANALFSLPMDQKLKAARIPNGADGYGIVRISCFFPKLMWSEGFTIVGSPLENARKLWPQHYNKFCDLIEKYEKEMKKLAVKLMWLILGLLDITEEDLKWASPDGEFGDALQLNYYPTCPEPDRAIGLAPHTDSTILTILHQNSTTGLQVLQEGIGWTTIPSIQGALVVNIGDLLHILSNGKYPDLLHILSNGKYPSALHRAVVNGTHHRLSVAYFHGPPTGVKVSPLKKLTDSSRPPLYKSVTWSEYLGIKAIHFNKALSMIKTKNLIID